MKPPSHAQQWARERNWIKAQLVGMRTSLNRIISSEILIYHEESECYSTLAHIEEIINYWDMSNAEAKEAYLKRKEIYNAKR